MCFQKEIRGNVFQFIVSMKIGGLYRIEIKYAFFFFALQQHCLIIFPLLLLLENLIVPNEVFLYPKLYVALSSFTIFWLSRKVDIIMKLNFEQKNRGNNDWMTLLWDSLFPEEYEETMLIVSSCGSSYIRGIKNKVSQ